MNEKTKTLMLGLGALLMLILFFSVIVHIYIANKYDYIEVEEGNYYKIEKKFDRKGFDSRLVFEIYDENGKLTAKKNMECIGIVVDYETNMYYYNFVSNRYVYLIIYDEETDEYSLNETYF